MFPLRSMAALAIQRLKRVRRERTLLKKLGIAMLVEAKFVPADPSAACNRVDRLHREDGFVAVELAIDQSLHDLIALRVQIAVGSGWGTQLVNWPSHK